MRQLRHALLVLGWTCALALPARADIAFPARLDIVEISPGEFEAQFALPIIGGRKLAAKPIFPPRCEMLESPEVTSGSSSHLTRYHFRADPPSLAGDAILINGMRGGQTEVAFTLETLDGRQFQQVLRASRPGFLVPGPPSRLALAVAAILEGTRHILRNLPLWILILIAGFSGLKRRRLAEGVFAAAIGHGCGQWLAARGWLELGSATPEFFALGVALLPAAALGGVSIEARRWFEPYWLTAVLMAGLFGASRPEALPTEGLSNGEQSLAVIFFGVGVGLAWLLISAIGAETRQLVARIPGRRGRARLEVALGTISAALAGGTLLAHFLSAALFPAGASLHLGWLAASALLCGLVLAGMGRLNSWSLAIFAALAALGGLAIVFNPTVPLGSTLVLGSICVLGLPLVMRRGMAGRWFIATVLVAIPVISWSGAIQVAEISARPAGLIAGSILVAVCALKAGLVCGRQIVDGRLPRLIRLSAGTLVALALFQRIAEYRDWYDLDLATEASLGALRLPLLAIGLIVVTWLVWPRQGRVARQLGVAQGGSFRHWLVLGLAVFLIPFGTLSVRNPFFEPEAPRGDGARRVVTKVLSDTYHAFNIADEGELYDQLDESVTVELIDDVFLDSRRRLKAGTREGAEVKVREVSVLEIGDPVADHSAGQDIAYECSWRVVARVRHLQHVHHRRNIYRGVLTLRADGDRWKIAGLELLSEDRTVVPWNRS